MLKVKMNRNNSIALAEQNFRQFSINYRHYFTIYMRIYLNE